MITSARKLVRIALVAAMMSTIGIALTMQPSAADSTILRTITAQNFNCSVGTGIAFDGTNLLLSCHDNNTITAVSPTDGAFVRSYAIAGLSSIGALGFDRARDIVWACGGFSADDTIVYKIDLKTQAATQAFAGTQGCPDGLAYDSSDDSLYVSADVATTVQHYGTDGTLLANIDVTGKLGGCGNSGLAVAGDQLLLSNNGCSEIYIAPKDVSSATLFGSYPSRLEDMECDDATFAGDNKAAIWSKDAYDGVLNAFDLGSADCGLNGYRDSDGDGLSDDWETHGADLNSDGVIDLDLPAMGANPLRKDLFAEIDWLTKDPRKLGPIPLGGGWDERPSTSATNKVEAAFRNWPVPNPDGSQGINLHLDAGPDSIMNPLTGAKWGNRSRANAIRNGLDIGDWNSDWTHMDTFRLGNVDLARRSAFHYVIYGHKLGCSNGSCFTGWSRDIPGHDLVIANGSIDTQQQEAVTLAHELGHNLGLGHGGRKRTDDPDSRDVNRKANYLSIMNYFYNNTGLTIHGGGDQGIIQFSSQELETLHTDNLPEQAGLTPDPFGHIDAQFYCPNGKVKRADSWTSIDWDCDTHLADGSSNPRLQFAAGTSANPTTVLGSEDYHHLYFWGTGAGFDARNAAIVSFDQPGTQEPSVEEAKADGVWYPQVSLQNMPTVELVAYAGTGKVAVPLQLTNPGAAGFSVSPQLEAGGAPGYSLTSSTPITIAPAAIASAPLVLDTSGLAAGSDAETFVNYLSDSEVIGQSRVIVHVIDGTPTAAACDIARQAQAAADVPPEQLPAIAAFLAKCGAGDTPVATPDTATTNEDTPATITVLANDSNPAGGQLQITGQTQPGHGTSACTATQCVYTPALNYNGPDSFTYTVTNAAGKTATATVTVSVTPVNDPPVAVNDSLATKAGAVATIVPVLANDTDSDHDQLVVTGANLTGPGGVSFSPTGVTYTPPATLAAPVTAVVTYTISDGHGGTASAKVTISVAASTAGVTLSKIALTVRSDRVVYATGHYKLNGGTFSCGQAVAVTLGSQTISVPSGKASSSSKAIHRKIGNTCVIASAGRDYAIVLTVNLAQGTWAVAATFPRKFGLQGPGPIRVSFSLQLGTNKGSTDIYLYRTRDGYSTR